MRAVYFNLRFILFASAGGLASISAARAASLEPRRGRPGPVQQCPHHDGTGGPCRPGHVLVQECKITQADSTSLDGQRRVLMGRLTDAHRHRVFAPKTIQSMKAADTGLMYANEDRLPGSTCRLLVSPGVELGDEAAFRAASH